MTIEEIVQQSRDLLDLLPAQALAQQPVEKVQSACVAPASCR